MAIALTQSKAVARILDAFGLKRVKTFELRMDVNDVVRIVTHQYAENQHVERLADEVEQHRWVLLPKEEHEDLLLRASTLSDMKLSMIECENVAAVAIKCKHTLAPKAREALIASWKSVMERIPNLPPCLVLDGDMDIETIYERRGDG